MNIKNIVLTCAVLSFNASAQIFEDSDPFGSTYPLVNECKNPDPYMPYPAECLYNKTQSNNVIFSKSDKNSEIQFINTKSTNETSTHIVFKSKLSGEIISATMKTNNVKKAGGFMLQRPSLKALEYSNGKLGAVNSSITINLPKGQIIFENNTISVMTGNKFAKISYLDDFNKADKMNYKKFHLLYEEVTHESDLLEFSEALNAISMQKFDFACFSARVGLVAAETALVVSVGAAVFTVGASTPAVVASIVVVAAAQEAVSDACGS